MRENRKSYKQRTYKTLILGNESDYDINYPAAPSDEESAQSEKKEEVQKEESEVEVL